MNHKQGDYKDNQNETVFIEMTGWALHYRPDKVSQPWSILETHDNKLSAINRAYQISGEYFMVKVTDPDGSITWSK